MEPQNRAPREMTEAEMLSGDDVRVGDIIKPHTCGDCNGTGRCDARCHTGWRSAWGWRFWMWGKCELCYGTGVEPGGVVTYVRPQ